MLAAKDPELGSFVAGAPGMGACFKVKVLNGG